MRRHALLIGIDDYSRGYFPNLRGCVNDVRLMENVLCDRYGFVARDIVRLENSDATRQAILDQLARLQREVQSDDVVIVHYSGHGSVMTDREGDSPSGVDETLVPHDSGRQGDVNGGDDVNRGGDVNRDITDDEIRTWLASMGEVTPFITLIIDACHSGGMSRDRRGVAGGSVAGVREVMPDCRPVHQLPPSPLGVRAVSRPRGAASGSRWLPAGGDRHVFLAACRDREKAREIRVPRDHGALSYHLAIELLSAGADATSRDVFERTRIKVTAANPAQHPRFEAAIDREVFGIRDHRPMRHVLVTERRERTVTLAAGAAHGLTTGSQWAVYPGVDSMDARRPCAMVEIRSLESFRASARVLEEGSDRPIEVGCRAVERSHDHGDMRMVVEIVRCEGDGHGVGHGNGHGERRRNGHGDDRGDGQETRRTDGLIDGLMTCLRTSQMLRPVLGPELVSNQLGSNHARVYLLGPRKTVTADDRFADLGPLVMAWWVATDAHDQLILPPYSVAESGVGRRLCHELETWARYRQMLLLDSHNSDGLAGKVGFELMRWSRSGGWQLAARGTAGDAPGFTEGDRIAACVVNGSDRSIFVSLFEFGLSGSVRLIVPHDGAGSSPVAPGSSIILDARGHEGLELCIPESIRQDLRTLGGDGRGAGGMAHFKLIITRKPVDFSFLVQDSASVSTGTRRGGTATLEQLLAAAYHGGREGERRSMESVGAWHTITRSLWLRRRDRVRGDGPMALGSGSIPLATSPVAGPPVASPSVPGPSVPDPPGDRPITQDPEDDAPESRSKVDHRVTDKGSSSARGWNDSSSRAGF